MSSFPMSILLILEIITNIHLDKATYYKTPAQGSNSPTKSEISHNAPILNMKSPTIVNPCVEKPSTGLLLSTRTGHWSEILQNLLCKVNKNFSKILHSELSALLHFTDPKESTNGLDIKTAIRMSCFKEVCNWPGSRGRG